MGIIRVKNKRLHRGRSRIRKNGSVKKSMESTIVKKRKQKKKPILTEEEIKKTLEVYERPANTEGKIFKAYIEEVKENIHEMEGRNYQFIIAYHGDKKWWVMGDHSAHMLGNQLGRPDIIKRDPDFYSTFKLGRVSRQDVAKTLEGLKNITIVMKNDSFYIVKLKTAYTKEAMQAILNAKKNLFERLRKIVPTKYALTKTTTTMVEFYNMYQKLISLVAKNMHSMGYINKNIKDVLDNVDEIYFNFTKFCNGRISSKRFFAIAEPRLQNLKDWITAQTRLYIFSVDMLARLAQVTCQLEDELRADKAKVEQYEEAEVAKNAK